MVEGIGGVSGMLRNVTAKVGRDQLMKAFERSVGKFIFYLEASGIKGLRQICIFLYLQQSSGLSVENELEGLVQMQET